MYDSDQNKKKLSRQENPLLESPETIPSCLRESSELLERLFATTHFLIAYMNRDFNFIRVNKAYADADGHPPEYFPGKNHFDLYPNKENETIFRETLETGKPYTIYAKPFEYPDHPEWGTTYWDWSLYPVLDVKGSVEGLLMILLNVTDRRKDEEKLRQAAAVFEHTAEALIITDPEANITDINRAFSEITGYSWEEVIGQNPRFLKSWRHEKPFYEAMWQSLLTTGYWRGEIWNRRKNGEIFPVWSTISAIHDNAGKLTHYVSLFSDITSLKRSEEQLYYLAHHDPLTELPNRLLFNDRLEHAMVRARREKYLLALLFLDLDRFKNINDSFGHPTGDKLLQEAARRITRQVREEDTVARLGGDEFIILMEQINESGDAAILATKLIQTFTQPFAIDDSDLHVTVSIGISIFPEDGNDATSLIRNADSAMYWAKEEGRNDFQFYTRELTSRAFEKVLLETSLRRALERDEFQLFYQPQVSLKTGLIIGAEALLRWQHPTMGPLLPSKFIPLAEETGLIVSIGEWVLRTACARMKEWAETGIALDRMSVNVSGTQINRGDSDFPGSVRKILAETNLNPRFLELELTESVIMEKTERTMAVMERLTKVGIRLAIDDFGTGFSSLSQLKQMPVNRLKIDQSFVRGIPYNADDKAIVCAVIALGYILKIEVTAEGVETEEQRGFLMEQGCGEMQGYFTGAPMPAEEFEKFMMRQP